MRIAVVSDTHIPTREESIPDEFRDRIADADHTIHVGDFETEAVLQDVRDLANDLTAVHGNIDPVDIDLPTVDTLEADGVTFVVTHGTRNLVESAVYSGQSNVAGREDWLQAIADTARARSRAWDGDGIVGVGGHTHQVEDEVYEGVRVLNPGSVTGAAPAERATMLTVDVEDGDLDVTVHEQ